MIILLDTNIKDFLNQNSQAASKPSFETESFYNSVDVLCEGPIEGFVNYQGQTVNYININNPTTIGQGLYYNDTPVIDPKTNLYNFTQSSFLASFGEQTKNCSIFSQAVYEYKTRIYDIPKAIVTDQANNIEEPVPFKPANSNNQTGFELQTFSSLTVQANSLNEKYKKYKNFSTIVSHSVQNKYSENFDFNISLDTLYSIKNNDTTAGPVSFVIEAQNLSTGIDYYLYFNGSFVAKGGAIILPFRIEVEPVDKSINNFPTININVYSVRGSVSSSTDQFRTISLDSVVEYIKYPFSFPYSAVTFNTISSRHFNAIPTRSYDCKLLKIRVPDNYDGEAREYSGNWSGNFNKSLKWTDNPAWIFYDLCTNGRYGMAKGQIDENDLNKWQFLTLSKYCDELVKTNSRTKFTSDLFYFDNDLEYGEEDFNTITFSTSLTESQINERYPVGSVIYLYDVRNELDESIDYNYKKLICSVSLTSGVAKLKLCNDFGPRKILEQDLRGQLFMALTGYLNNNPNQNIENKIKLYILKYFIGDNSLGLPYFSQDTEVSKSHMKKKIFDTSLKVLKGYCVAKHDEYPEFLEPRFSCNVLINSENEGLKTLTDLASIFRGIFYFRNGLLNLTSDVKQKSVYIFTNSNVKQGLFTYASSDLNTSFSVAKVPYLDRNDKFKDKIVYVEDQDLIRKFGIVEKEILSFGVTSRSEAQRIGKWYLATGKLESEIVGFVTGIEATLLQIGNVIRISDSLKNASIIYGKITALDFKNNYLYIDREVDSSSLGKNIKIFSVIDNNPIESDFTVLEVDNLNLRLKITSYPYMSWLVMDKITVSNEGKTLTSGGSVNVFDKKAYTNISFIDNCQISYSSPDAFNDQNVVGLSLINNPTLDETDINYGFQIVGATTSATLSVIQNGTPQSLAPEYQSVVGTDVMRITYDGEYVRYYKNDVLVYGPVARAKGGELHGVVAMKVINAKITNLYFSKYPAPTYGKYSELRSGANFSIYVNDSDSQFDLFKIISINEVSSNEYAISAMRYQEEKFKIIENNEYVDAKQDKLKQIVFSSDNEIEELFTDNEISSSLKIDPINYVDAVATDFDYSFIVENESLNGDYLNNKYEYITINFKNLFDILLIVKGVSNLYGLMCIINRNGKSLTFNVLQNQENLIKIFLGETQQGNVSYKTTVDFYAFDSNYRIINV